MDRWKIKKKKKKLNKLIILEKTKNAVQNLGNSYNFAHCFL